MNPQLDKYEGRFLLWMDQFGSKYYTPTLARLRELVGARPNAKFEPMFTDKYPDAPGAKPVTVQVGLIVRGYDKTQFWLTAYAPVEIEPAE